MNRSASHIGSLQDYKPKSLWKSMLNKEDSKVKSKGITRSQSTIASKSKRSSMIISEPSSIRNGGFKRLSMISQSNESIDPKEAEFYEKLNVSNNMGNLPNGNNRHRSMYFGATDYDDEDVDSLDFGTKSPISSKFINMDEKEPDMLTSALEDYKIFTTSKKATPSSSAFSSKNQTPTNMKFEENDDIANARETRMSSLPSFTSTVNTMESEISVLHVSNSLWIGSTITDYDLDEELMEKPQLDLDGLDPQSIFDDEDLGNTNRTSLVFV